MLSGRKDRPVMWRGLIEEYRRYLPVASSTPVVTLNEGNTPLIHAPWISGQIGARVYLKYEGLNPTGSFKDRGMTLALSKAKERGAKLVICASTGNTSASAAAYAARAGIRCVVLIPKGQIALGKLSQALIHEAKVIAVNGNFDAALQLVREFSKDPSVTIVNSLNPFRIEGQKTGAFEVCDQLEGIAPDFHAMPVGNAGNISAYWKGYKEYRQKGRIRSLPVMLGFQAEGAAPIVRGKIVAKPHTIATAIRIGNPAGWKSARVGISQSQGCIDIVSDAEILAAQKWLAVHEGIFVEPASAASIAGLLKCLGKEACQKCPVVSDLRTSLLLKPVTIVCTITGHGLKDPDIVKQYDFKTITVRPTREHVLKAMGF